MPNNDELSDKLEQLENTVYQQQYTIDTLQRRLAQHIGITKGGQQSVYAPHPDLLISSITGISGIAVVGKCTADTTVNNSETLVDVTGLSIELASDTDYYARLVIMHSSATAADVKIGWSYPSNCTIEWDSTLNYLANTIVNEATTKGFPGVAVGTKRFSEAMLVIRNGNGGGTLQAQMAQNTADASDAVVYEGSTLIAMAI